MQFLFQNIHGHIALLDSSSLFLRLGQRTLVDLLILVQRDSVDLHRHGRHHVRRFLVQNKVVEGLDVHLVVAHDISSDKFAATLLVKCLYRGILNAREFTDNTLDLFQLDAETANLHLSVATAHKLDIT